MITLPVEQNGNDYYVTFTDDLLEELGWNVGDDLNWDLQTDGSIIVTKLHDETTSADRPQCASSQESECFASYGAPIHDC